MKNDYAFLAKLYDPLLNLVLWQIRIAVMNELLSYKEKAILDLCCGTGIQLKLLSKNGFRNLHGLDISSPMLGVAKKNDYPIKIYNQDATKTGFLNESFDITILSFAIHEKDRITQENLINETHRLIKKNGFLLVVDFVFDNKTTKFSRTTIGIIERMAGREHYNNFKRYIQIDGLSSLIPKDKFKLIKDNRNILNGVTISIYQKILV